MQIQKRTFSMRKNSKKTNTLSTNNELFMLSPVKALSSQPTITRLENKLTPKELYKIGELFLDEFIRSYKKAPKVLILDCDDSNFNTYGEQQGTLFNDYYGEYCY